MNLPDGRSLILASKSDVRREILSRLRLPFKVQPSNIEENMLVAESAPNLVKRLAEWKARAVAKFNMSSLIIGADQVALLDNTIFGKPLYKSQAKEQLQQFSGKTVDFYTGVCLLDTDTLKVQVAFDISQVVFRLLLPSTIENYLEFEQPYNCAGSCKVEGLGIALFERIESNDPTSILGLPLIKLISMLKSAGIQIL